VLSAVRAILSPPYRYAYNCLGATTTVVFDQIIRHSPNSGIFNMACLNEKVGLDVQAAFLKCPSIDERTHAFIPEPTCNLRASIDALEEVMNALPPNLEIVKHCKILRN
jgi:hypothetical protein